MKKIPVSVHIGRPTQSGGSRRDCCIEITDKVSGCRVVNVRLTFKALAEIVLGHGEVDASGEFVLNNLGKTRESKRVVVEWSYWTRNDPGGDKDSALKPFEVDGWIGSEYDLGNHHKSVPGMEHCYDVGFVRWV